MPISPSFILLNFHITEVALSTLISHFHFSPASSSDDKGEEIEIVWRNGQVQAPYVVSKRAGSKGVGGVESGGDGDGPGMPLRVTRVV